MTPHIISIPEQAFVARATELIAQEIRTAIAARGSCRLALAGGGTPRPIYEALAGTAGIDWSQVWITFGDERCVPPEDEASNYRMAKESLLQRVPIPLAQVLRIRGELSQEEAAAEYEALLLAEAVRVGEDRFVHDLILLGMGEDGHTASLFPGMDVVEEQRRSVVPAFGPKPPPQRVSMTLPLLNASRKIFFLVKGLDKEPVLRRVLAGDRSFPSARVQPTQGEVAWLLPKELAQAVQA